MKTRKVNPYIEIAVAHPEGYAEDWEELRSLLKELENRNYLLPRGASSWMSGFRGRVTHKIQYECEGCGAVFDAEDKDLVNGKCDECGAEICDECRYWGEHDETLCEVCYHKQQAALMKSK